MTTILNKNLPKQLPTLWTQVVPDKIKQVHFSQTGDIVLIQGEQGDYAYDARSGSPAYRYGHIPYLVSRPLLSENPVIVSPDGSRKAVYNLFSNGETTIVEQPSGKTVFTLDDIIPDSFEFSPDSKKLAYAVNTTGSRYKDLPAYRLNIADTASGKSLVALPIEGGAIYSKDLLVFAPDWKKVAFFASGENPNLYVLDTLSGTLTSAKNLLFRSWGADPFASNTRRFLVFSPDSATVAVAERDNTLRVLQV